MATGKYSMNVPAGTYNVKASKVGYIPQSTENVKVSGGQTTTISFQLIETAPPQVTIEGNAPAKIYVNGNYIATLD